MNYCVFVALNFTLSGAYPEVRNIAGKVLTTNTNVKKNKNVSIENFLFILNLLFYKIFTF